MKAETTQFENPNQLFQESKLSIERHESESKIKINKKESYRRSRKLPMAF